MVHFRVKGAKAAHKDHLHICPQNLVIELDPDMSVDGTMYVFRIDE